jgi:hypothetical protein
VSRSNGMLYHDFADVPACSCNKNLHLRIK